MFLPLWKFFYTLFVYHLMLEALQKLGLVKSK